MRKAGNGRLHTLPSMNIRRRLHALLVLLALTGGGAVEAATAEHDDYIAERGVLEDPAGELTLAQVMDREFRPYTTPFSTGSKRQPLWFRLVVPPQPEDAQPLVLLVQPPVLRDIRVYTQTDQNGWAEHTMGSRYAFRDRSRQDLNFSMNLQASTEKPTVIYLRVDSHTSTVHAQVASPEQARALDAHLHGVLGIYLGLALVFALLSALMWWATRDALWGTAAVFDLITMLQSSLVLGLLPKYVLPAATDTVPWLFALSAATHLTACCVVFALLVRALQAPRWAVMGYLAVLPIYAVWLLLIASGRLGETLVQVNQAALLASLWGIVAMSVIRTPDRLLAWTYRLFTGALIAYLLVWILPLLRPGTTNPLSLYPTLPTNLVTMLMVSLILARRTFLAMRERQRLEREAQEAAQRLRLEQAHHAETEGMLGMIMHEMKNPLASIRLASELLSSGRVDSKQEQAQRFRNIQDAVDGIDAVLNRCIDVDRLERGVLAEVREPEDVADLLSQWLTLHRQRGRILAALPEQLDARVDARLLLLMLGNLTDNALKYSPPDQPVALRVQREPSQLAMEVRNRVGRAGWPDPDRLFQKYYRAPAAQGASGTGLGLYWVRQVAERVGGRVDYRREDDDAVFTLRIPA